MNIPDHINNKRNIVRLIGFTALFALIFINIYKPFSSSLWYNISEFMFFVYSSLVILTGLLVVLISRIIMYLYSRRHTISYGKYALWVFLEILLMSVFYTMYTIILNKERDVMETFESSFINTALVLLLPYIVLWFYFGWRESSTRLEKIERADDEETDTPGNITFNDEKGTLRLSVLCSDLLYIESSENYVVINYSNKGKVKKYLLRNTLKNIEGALERSRIVRCHRSYLVNLDRAKVIRRDREGLYIELDTEGVIDIPVSKSYQKKVSETFLAHSFKVLN
ncbi:MAG: LytTR family transcriptional regulator [Bacteroidetes bacterium GWF2_41_61]|nr:MAG: LytTR family transcriptional regulator [Bacteroidetes bacterium GWE2_40_15]OFY33914.1 MAG: LytTR family transcriptional regulator [Bacteroidetes bacterium GWF2_41_61]OFY89180.1 MAG: LytTR family transcriptional regulator [Bacteroidetes bacterium RIFOXYA12_FULL_40_10]HBG24663.1 LytTR family transcriptional regulator [Rikenellaceae bacterium]HBZ25291.1 LytTR family transcriptional regulator [Rikenellaceae bacterium]